MIYAENINLIIINVQLKPHLCVFLNKTDREKVHTIYTGKVSTANNRIPFMLNHIP